MERAEHLLGHEARECQLLCEGASQSRLATVSVAWTTSPYPHPEAEKSIPYTMDRSRCRLSVCLTPSLFVSVPSPPPPPPASFFLSFCPSVLPSVPGFVHLSRSRSFSLSFLLFICEMFGMTCAPLLVLEEAVPLSRLAKASGTP